MRGSFSWMVTHCFIIVTKKFNRKDKYDQKTKYSVLHVRQTLFFFTLEKKRKSAEVKDFLCSSVIAA